MTYSNHINAQASNSYTNYTNYSITGGCDHYGNACSHTNRHANSDYNSPNYNSYYGLVTSYTYINHYNHYNVGHRYFNQTTHYNCAQVYTNHANKSITHPTAYTLGIAATAPDAWTGLSSAIADIKKLRNEINTLSTVKVKSTGAPLTAADDPVNTKNADAEFGPGKLARAEQINETISNVERLWRAIKGSTSGFGLTSKTAGVSPRKKQDYKDIIAKAQELANCTQTSGYANHTNTGSGVSGYANTCSHCTNTSCTDRNVSI
ncbi:MAG: hypothetical protein LBQ83_01395 [Candidatus Margulisbacteria bacterium]|jgi:hypothetical protein|nr:hypothetical protein [Candidatus Margulisiibacteriota bacterium]